MTSIVARMGCTAGAYPISKQWKAVTTHNETGGNGNQFGLIIHEI